MAKMGFHRKLMLVVLLMAGTALAPARAGVMTVDFSDMSAFMTGDIITNEFAGQGVTFSIDPTGLTTTSTLPRALNTAGQEHVVSGGLLFNLFRADLTAAAPLISVTVGFSDSNVADQIHTLIAFDAAGSESGTTTVEVNEEVNFDSFDRVVGFVRNRCVDGVRVDGK